MTENYCFDCEYFVPEDSRHNNLKPEDWNEAMPGDCRRICPVARKPSNDDRYINFAYWPTVMASDWCGQFRTKTINDDQTQTMEEKKSCQGTQVTSGGRPSCQS